jgi:glutathione S-transferase
MNHSNMLCLHSFRGEDMIAKMLASAIGTGHLRNDKCTYADLAFATWAAVGEGLLREITRLDGFVDNFPRYTAWLAVMGVKKVKKGEGTDGEGTSGAWDEVKRSEGI